jgi:hypothetical protein
MRRNAAFRLKPRRCRMLGGDRAHGPGPPRLERTSACAFAEHPADKLAHSLPGNSKHPGKLAPRPARQIVSTLRPSLSTMGNGEEDFSMKIQGTRSASAVLALSPKSVGDPSGEIALPFAAMIGPWRIHSRASATVRRRSSTSIIPAVLVTDRRPRISPRPPAPC